MGFNIVVFSALLGGVIVSLTSFTIFKKVFNPIFIIVCWWLGWFIIAELSITGVFSPSLKVYLLLVVFLISIVIGIFSSLATRKTSITDAVLTREDNIQTLNRIYKVYKKILYVIIPFFTYYSIVSLNLMRQYGFIGYRQLVGQRVNGEHIFFNTYTFYLYDIVASSLVFSYFVYSIIATLYTKKMKYLSISFILVAFKSIIMFNRLDMYYLFVMIAVGFVTLYSNKKKQNLNRKSKFIVVVSLFVLILGVTNMSSYRSQNVSLLSLENNQLIEYHTLNFALLDIEVSNDNSLLYNKPTYGMGMVGGIERIMTTFIRRIVPSYESIVWDGREEHWSMKIVGSRKSGMPILANSHYNLIYTFYRDGRFVTLILWSYIWGAIIGRNYLIWNRRNDIQYLFLYLLSISSIGIFSLFRGFTEKPDLWISMGLFLFFKHKFSKRKGRIYVNKKIVN